MSRYNPHADNVDKIYETASKVWETCFAANGSLFFPGSEIWTLELLRKLKEALMDDQGASKSGFMEKFKAQLQNVRDKNKNIYRLAAEMLYIHFLFSSNISSKTKLDRMNEILIAGGVPSVESDHELVIAYHDGIGSTGQSYNIRRFKELSFLIDFSIKLKEKNAKDKKLFKKNRWNF